MPADRGRPSMQTGASERDECGTVATAWSSAASIHNYAPNDTPEESTIFKQEMHPMQRAAPRRKKSLNHIPQVETSHSTLSKIIGLTWKNLSETERQKWHALAKVALDEHRRQFPQYSFRPVHAKSKGAAGERRKLREVGPQNQKRCAKIAELLVCGKKGQELEEAIQEFDKHHVPEIITRFDTPITANTYISATKERRSPSPVACNQVVQTPQQKSRIPMTLESHPEDSTSQEAPKHSLETYSFNLTTQSPSFDYDSFSFSIDTSQSFPMDLPNENYTMAHKYEVHNPTRLSPISNYADDWPGRNSPLSTSTSSSMPTTPLQLCAPFDAFAEPFNPGAYPINNTGTDYTMTGDAYCDFTQYPPFSVPEPGYGISCIGPGHEQQSAHAHAPPLASGLALGDGRFHLPPVNLPHLEQQLDFSSLMNDMASHSSTSYL